MIALAVVSKYVNLSRVLKWHLASSFQNLINIQDTLTLQRKNVMQKLDVSKAVLGMNYLDCSQWQWSDPQTLQRLGFSLELPSLTFPTNHLTLCTLGLGLVWVLLTHSSLRPLFPHFPMSFQLLLSLSSYRLPVFLCSSSWERETE